MKSFFLSVIKQSLALLMAGVIMGYLLIVFIWIVVGFIEAPVPVHVAKNSVLVIDLRMGITDAAGEKDIVECVEDLIFHGMVKTSYLYEILNAIEAATEDDRIVGIFLVGEGDSYQKSGYPVLHEVRKAIEEFQKSGKMVVSYFTQVEVKDYFLGSVANTVVINPLGQVELKGLSVETTYLGEAFERYGIGVQVTKSGKYKSAVEVYTLSHMSDFEKEQTTTLLGDIWDNVSEMIGESRKLGKNEIMSLSEKTALFSATEAKDRGLVDFIGHEDEAFDRFSLEGVKNDDSLEHRISLKKYIKDVENKKLLKRATARKNKIGIVYIEGEIMEGEGSSFNAGADRLENRLKEVREDKDIKSVVLRVNSPGGGVYASEKILRAARLLQAKKPVVVSFGNYAASGGYWVSCYGNAIFADRMTITGSIGIFGLMPDIEKIGNRYGINFDAVSTGPFATINSYYKPRTAEELVRLQGYTDLMYHAFLDRVAEGRKMDIKDVEGIAQGRVWSGFRAKEIGLVDFYGGLKDAIAHAAMLAELSDGWEVFQYARNPGFWYGILQLLQDKSEIRASVRGVLGEYWSYVKKEVGSFSSFNDPSSVYARMPYRFEPK